MYSEDVPLNLQSKCHFNFQRTRWFRFSRGQALKSLLNSYAYIYYCTMYSILVKGMDKLSFGTSNPHGLFYLSHKSCCSVPLKCPNVLNVLFLSGFTAPLSYKTALSSTQ